MVKLVAAAAVFLGLHFLIAGTPARDRFIRLIGEGPYRGLFVAASLAAILWLVTAYNAAQTGPGDPMLYDLGRGVHDMGIVVIAFAFWLGVQGLLTPIRISPEQEVAMTGVSRITRHPLLWGIVLWAGFHLAANGDQASVILFGTFLLLALFGTFSLDAKRKRRMGEAWEHVARKTSNLPFAAVLEKRNTINLSESFGWRFWVALILFVAILFAHARLFGVSPFPGGYVPF